MTSAPHFALPSISPVDPAIAHAVQRQLDQKTKPLRSLGRLEDLACRYAAIRGELAPAPARKAIVVMGADHGVTEEGVSAYPREVTAQMLLNFAAGGAAINVLARQADAQLVVVDMGVQSELSAPQIRSAKVAHGTRNFTREPAMTREQVERALQTGVQLARELADAGVTLLGIGEMGIGNTTAASALAAVLLSQAPEEVTGRGTGIDDAAYLRKVNIIQRGIACTQPDATDPLDVLTKLGGLEIAGLAGVVLGAASRRVAVVMDGFIATTAALVAARITPAARDYLIASHRSVEAGHRLVLQALGQLPLLDLDLRLGEGTGAALAMPLVDAALRVLAEMATFASAGVSDRGA
jgi:nicotinate-nucleotide--dimethylbenzimidazole phosphoribosyltransferase